MKTIPTLLAPLTISLLFSALVSAQNVGVGTTTPATTLHLFNTNTNANTSTLILEANSGFGGSTYSGIEFRSNASSTGTGPSGRIKSYYSSPLYTSSKITFQTIAAGPSFVDAMTLVNGMVGIGTTAPVNRLDVAGGLAIGSTYAGSATAPANGAIIEGNAGIGTSSPATTLHLFNTNTNANTSTLILEANSGFGGSTYSGIEFRSNASSTGTGPSGRIKSYYSSPLYTSSKITFQTIAAGPSFVDAMTLTNASVGIGTTAPVNRLDVAGGLAIGSTYAGSATAPANGAIIEGNAGIGTSSPETSLHIKNANTNSGNSTLILEANSNFGAATYSGIEFRSNPGSVSTGPSGRIKSYYSSPLYTSSKITFQTVAAGPSFVDAMTLVNGMVGIGTTSPATALDVTSADNITANFTSSSSDPNGVITITVPSTNSACNTCSEFIEFFKGGTQIGTITANLSGNSVSYNTTSDGRLKENITSTKFGIGDIMKIGVKDYNFIGTDRVNRVTGFIAQDLFSIYPFAVKEGDYGDKVVNQWAIDYGKLTPLLVKGMQDQQQQIDQLQDEIEALKKQNELLKNEVGEIEKLKADFAAMLRGQNL